MGGLRWFRLLQTGKNYDFPVSNRDVRVGRPLANDGLILVLLVDVNPTDDVLNCLLYFHLDHPVRTNQWLDLKLNANVTVLDVTAIIDTRGVAVDTGHDRFGLTDVDLGFLVVGYDDVRRRKNLHAAIVFGNVQNGVEVDVTLASAQGKGILR